MNNQQPTDIFEESQVAGMVEGRGSDLEIEVPKLCYGPTLEELAEDVTFWLSTSVTNYAEQEVHLSQEGAGQQEPVQEPGTREDGSKRTWASEKPKGGQRTKKQEERWKRWFRNKRQVYRHAMARALRERRKRSTLQCHKTSPLPGTDLPTRAMTLNMSGSASAASAASGSTFDGTPTGAPQCGPPFPGASNPLSTANEIVMLSNSSSEGGHGGATAGKGVLVPYAEIEMLTQQLQAALAESHALAERLMVQLTKLFPSFPQTPEIGPEVEGIVEEAYTPAQSHARCAGRCCQTPGSGLDRPECTVTLYQISKSGPVHLVTPIMALKRNIRDAISKDPMCNTGSGPIRIRKVKIRPDQGIDIVVHSAEDAELLRSSPKWIKYVDIFEFITYSAHSM